MSAEPPFWRDALAPYAQPHLGRSLLDLATSLAPYLALLVLMYLALDVSYLLVLALAFPAAGFMLLVSAVQARQRLAGHRPGAGGVRVLPELAPQSRGSSRHRR